MQVHQCDGSYGTVTDSIVQDRMREFRDIQSVTPPCNQLSTSQSSVTHSADTSGGREVPLMSVAMTSTIHTPLQTDE